MIIKKKNQNFHKKITHQEEIVGAINDVNSQVPEVSQEDVSQEAPKQEETTKQEIDLFDIENIDFEQRQERRRGSRRRGYRRIDDRNLVSRAKEESENIKKSAFEEGY
ncbi:MAG: hypothetical protein MJ231_03605, partial [bacterium]|nr:hypothetical protein [bacterium]